MASKYTEDVSVEEDAKSEKKGAAAEDEEDPRLEFMFSYLQTSVRLKPDKWAKLLGNKESAKYIYDFLQRPDIQLLVLSGSTSGVLQPMHGFPSASSRLKSCYFIRKTAEPVTKENFRNILIFGDVAAKPVDQLAVVVQEVFVPLLSNPKNQRNWPRVVNDDVMKHIYELKNIVYEVRGKINGQTLLPMPVGIERVHEVEQTIRESKGKSVDLYLKSAIEGIVIKWATQIDEVLKEDSSCAYAKESNPTPRFEIDFWNSRLKNLECIYDQLRDPRVKKMASILHLTDSAYFSCFKTQFQNIVAAVSEARDITLYLKPLIKHFDILENTDFKDAQSLLRPMVHCVALVWANSRYYCTSNKIITLVKEIANLLIQENQFVDMENKDGGGGDDDTVNFSALETELQAAIEEDAKYWQENGAKFRALEQRVATYDEFRDLVKASHLKPLDKTEKLNSFQSKRSSIWNSLAAKKKQGIEMETTQSCSQNVIQQDGHMPRTTVEFVRQWRPMDICDRLLLLKLIGAQNVGQLVKSEIPVGILGEILQALLAFPSNTPDIVFVVRLLESLTEAKRFNLSLQFLSNVEKATCKQLMEKLNSSFQNRQQDLAEEGITEWTVLELKNKYKV